MVEAGGVGLQSLNENTQVIENTRRTTRWRRTKSSSDVHGVYTEPRESREVDSFLEILTTHNISWGKITANC